MDPTLAASPALEAPETVDRHGRRWFYRHPLVIRLAHWINAAVLLVLLMSGLQIFNAHPALYWGATSTFDSPALAITSEQRRDGTHRGVVTVGGHTFDTTGVLGLSKEQRHRRRSGPSPPGRPCRPIRTSPPGGAGTSCSPGLLVINGAIYLLYGLVSGQLRRRLIPDGDQIRDFGGSVTRAPHPALPRRRRRPSATTCSRSSPISS